MYIKYTNFHEMEMMDVAVQLSVARREFLENKKRMVKMNLFLLLCHPSVKIFFDAIKLLVIILKYF